MHHFMNMMPLICSLQYLIQRLLARKDGRRQHGRDYCYAEQLTLREALPG